MLLGNLSASTNAPAVASTINITYDDIAISHRVVYIDVCPAMERPHLLARRFKQTEAGYVTTYDLSCMLYRRRI